MSYILLKLQTCSMHAMKSAEDVTLGLRCGHTWSMFHDGCRILIL